jgi:two-component system NarL family response regulator
MCGAEATRQIREICPDAKVVALSLHDSERIISNVICAGARGCVSKRAPADEILKAIRAVAAGRSYPPYFALPADSRNAYDNRRHAALSNREIEVLQLVVEGKMSKQIADQLCITTKTVEWHRRSIMTKLNVRSVAELTKYAIREGLTSLEV